MAHGRDDLDPERLRVILAVETSCDDTCAAVVTEHGEIRSNVISSQGVHDRFGGVVPEIASRHHLELVGHVIDDALDRAETSLDALDLVAVTAGPGLVAALLVGLSTAKGIAAAFSLPLAAVDHLHGHVAASWRIDEAREFECSLLPPRVLAPEALAEVVAPLGPATLAIGDGAIRFREVLERSGSFIPEDDSPLHKVAAVNHCRLADHLEGGAPDGVRPDYLRAPDAEIAHRTP